MLLTLSLVRPLIHPTLNVLALFQQRKVRIPNPRSLMTIPDFYMTGSSSSSSSNSDESGSDLGIYTLPSPITTPSLTMHIR